jgi:hypothetical protein
MIKIALRLPCNGACGTVFERKGPVGAGNLFDSEGIRYIEELSTSHYSTLANCTQEIPSLNKSFMQRIAMSDIPFRFKSIPEEFFTDEFIEDIPMMKLIRYIFKRIRTKPHTEEFKNNRTSITIDLDAWQFVYGRDKAAEECSCSDKVIRTRINRLRASSYLEEIMLVTVSERHFSTVRASSSEAKRASSSQQKRASTFTVYRLRTESFTQIEGQQFKAKKGQQKGQQFGKKKGHKEDIALEKIDKKTTTPTPSKGEAVDVVSKQTQEAAIEEAAFSLKTWLDNQATITRKRKITPTYSEEITWGNDWLLPLQTFENLLKKHGYDYFQDQLTHMVRCQESFDNKKSEKPVLKPEAFLKISCKNNYAGSKQQR